jgi:molecular chaperone GrpE
MKSEKDRPKEPGQDEIKTMLKSQEGDEDGANAQTAGELPQDSNFEEEFQLTDQLKTLQESLQDMTAKADEYLDGWQRSRAEFANYKKRISKENNDIRQYARGEVIKIYLDVLDDLERALREKPEDSDETWAEGIEIIYQKLKSRLEAEGIRPMEALGEEFDPNIHEALMKEESDEYESGEIIEVMQEGYWIGEKVLRPALVRVAA